MTEEIKEQEKQMDPQDYFAYVKQTKKEMTDEFLDSLHNIVTKQIGKAMVTGQTLQARRLAYTLGTIKKEHELLKNDINVYVLRETIETFINDVADKAVKIVDLQFYPREIPDEIFEKVQKLKEKNLFDNYYVVFTDYTGETTKEVTEERKRRDPILFGVFEHKIDNIWNICDRFYFIGDWEDEYCDLTLTKMVQKMSEKGITDITHNLSLPEVTEESVRTYVNALEEAEENDRFRIRTNKKKSFFNKVKTAWKALTEQ